MRSGFGRYWRQPPIPIPNKLRAHLRRWERNGARFVVDVDGQRVGSVKTAWRTALTEAGIELTAMVDTPSRAWSARPASSRSACANRASPRPSPVDTAITWAMQRGIDKWTAAGFFGVTLEVLEGTLRRHHLVRENRLGHFRLAVEAMATAERDSRTGSVPRS